MTVTRTLRLDEDLDEALERLAREEGESVNVLANRALRKLVEWDFQAGKLGLMSFSRDIMVKLIESQTLEQAKELGRRTAKEIWMPMMLYLFGNVSVDSVIKSIDVIDRHMGRFTSEYSFREGKHHVTLRHGMGMKWSAFYAANCEEVITKMLGMDVVSTLTEDACFIEFQPKGMGAVPKGAVSSEQQ